MLLFGHLPDGGLADEDEEDEDPSHHVGSSQNPQCQLEIQSKIMN
jgi:hypothetical protein